MTFKEDCLDLLILQKEKNIEKNCVLNSFYIWNKYKSSIPSLKIKVGVFVSETKGILHTMVHTWLEEIKDGEKIIHDISYEVLMMRTKAIKYSYIPFKNFCKIQITKEFKQQILKWIINLENSIKILKQNHTGEFSLKQYLHYTKLMKKNKIDF